MRKINLGIGNTRAIIPSLCIYYIHDLKTNKSAQLRQSSNDYRLTKPILVLYSAEIRKEKPTSDRSVAGLVYFCENKCSLCMCTYTLVYINCRQLAVNWSRASQYVSSIILFSFSINRPNQRVRVRIRREMREKKTPRERMENSPRRQSRPPRRGEGIFAGASLRLLYRDGPFLISV